MQIFHLKYQEQYCKKHNQYYADFLKECPICVGERYKDQYKRKPEQKSTESKKI